MGEQLFRRTRMNGAGNSLGVSREQNGLRRLLRAAAAEFERRHGHIERVFRHLAKKFHPDNKESADSDRFRLIVEAHRTLSDLESRAGYDIKYQDYWNRKMEACV